MKLSKRNNSHNKSTEHMKIANSDYRDPKVNSNLINSLKSVESEKVSPKLSYKNDYNDYTNYNIDKGNNNENSNSSTGSRNKVKEFLNEVKEKLDAKRFKVFIKNVKILTDKSQTVNRKIVFDHVKMIFGDDHFELYIKFEHILSPRTSVKYS